MRGVVDAARQRTTGNYREDNSNELARIELAKIDVETHRIK